ncbi:MAG: hypothetical protein NTV28_17165 [Propionibacteriales bacterium]|nr:hypothetical protein [Propionibacteriales bacterium]
MRRAPVAAAAMALALAGALLAACGSGSHVSDGRQGLEEIKTRADRGLEQVAPAVGAAIEVEPQRAVGGYVQAGYSGSTLLYGYDAQVTFRADRPIDFEKVRAALTDLGLAPGAIARLPQGRQGITATADDHAVVATLDADRRRLVLKAKTSGAEVKSGSLSAEERANLRDPKPLSLDLD